MRAASGVLTLASGQMPGGSVAGPLRQRAGYGAGVGVRKEDAYLADAFSEVIHEMREDGTYQKISDEWFGFDVYGG